MRTKSILALSLCFFCVIPALAAAQVYKVTDLGPLAPTGINSWGQVVGNLNGHAFIWTTSQGRRSLGLLSGGTFSRAAAINDLGAVAGTADGFGTIISLDPSLPNQQCSDLTQPFIWTERNVMRGLGSVAGEGVYIGDSRNCSLSFYGAEINVRGQVIGYTAAYTVEYQFGFLWTSAGGMSEFGGSWPPTFANDISNTGEIVGENGQFIGHATSWKNGVTTDLGTLGAGADYYASAANGVNDLGFVVGWATTNPIFPSFSPSPVHAILWSPSGKMTDLGTLTGDTSSAAVRINLFGQVIGNSGNTDALDFANGVAPFEEIGRPFLWTESEGMRDLNTLVPLTSGWVLTSASDINIWGQIVGSGTRNGQPHGFLLTPRKLFQ
jgi:probable HAF family extracellular repeat protein